MNRDWHKAHRMLKNPTQTQRLEWHTTHSKHCDCRPVPKSVAEEIMKVSKEIKKRNAAE